MRCARYILAALLVWGLACPAAPPAGAGWLDAVMRGSGRAARHAPAHGAGALEHAASHVKALPVEAQKPALAAAGSHEGHWRFVNRAGETMTAASPEELARALNTLAPEAARTGRLALYLTEDTAFAHTAMLKDLPRSAELNVMVGRDAYPLLRQGEGQAMRLFASVRPRLVVELAERARFDEAMAQLARPLDKSQVRTIGLEPGGPASLTPRPKLDPATGRNLNDAIDPDRLRHALGAIRGQTVLLVGRIDRELFWFRPGSGPERSLLLRDLMAAAEGADVNLVVLRAQTPRQPGARNWLWQKVKVSRLDAAVAQSTKADFLDALAGESGRMAVGVIEMGPYRTRLEITPARGLPGGPAANPLGSAVSDVVAEVTGRVVVDGIEAAMRSAERDRELELRIVPAIPSGLQYGYIVALLLGLMGLPVVAAWWRRLWPPEVRSEYASAFAHRAAQAARGLAFLALFLPLTGPLGAVVHLVRRGTAILLAPVRWLGRRRSVGA